jgi:hypothetical protein
MSHAQHHHQRRTTIYCNDRGAGRRGHRGNALVRNILMTNDVIAAFAAA